MHCVAAVPSCTVRPRPTRLYAIHFRSGESSMRKLAAACALATLTLAAGCGSNDDSGSTAAAPSSSAAATSSSAATSPADAASSSSAAAATELTGTVGTKDDPNAFVISLTDSSGKPVDTLPAGDYTIAVHDLSAMHNFHLIGGSVDEKTAVPEVTDTTFDVTLAAGEYTLKGGPHADMTRSFDPACAPAPSPRPRTPSRRGSTRSSATRTRT